MNKETNEKGCTGMEAKLVEYLDGRATPALRHVVEEHLAVCTDCHLRAEEFRALWNTLDDLPELSPSRSFDAALRARIAADPARRAWWQAWLPAPRLAFAVTALVVMSVWLSSMHRVAPYKAPIPAPAAQTSADSEFGMIQDLPVLENYDVVSKFDALSELPETPGTTREQGVRESR